MSDTILVIGATGMLGEPVARRLQSAGWQVRVLTRSAHKGRARFGETFEVAEGDVEDPTALAAAIQGCRGVHINLQGGMDYDLERRGAEAVARAAARAGVERITYLSGASVCAENCWYAGTRAKYQAEAALQACGVGYTVFRSTYFMETLPNFLRGKLALLIGKHPHPYDWVAASDYAGMVARAYATPAAAGKILYVCGPQALSMRQAVDSFRRSVRPEARLVYVPLWAASLLARLGKRRELQAALPFFQYCSQVKVILSGSPAEANDLLGAPETTLEAWSRAYAARAAAAQ